MKKRRNKNRKTRITVHTPPSKKQAYIFLAMTLAGVFLIFAPNLNDGFLIDDAAFVYSALELFPDHLTELLKPDLDTYWRPVGKLSFVPDAFIWKYNPIGYHLTSLILYFISIGLVFGIARRIFPLRWASLTTAIFAFHPVHVGAVVWISARYDLLATVFILCVCLFYMKSLADMGRVNTAIALIFLTAAFLTKEIAFITPFLIFLIALFYGPSTTWNNLVGRWRGVGIYFLVTVLLIVIRLLVMGRIGGPGAHTGHPQVLAPEWGIVLGNYFRAFPSALLTPVNSAAFGSSASLIRPVVLVLGMTCFVGLLWFRNKKEIWVGLLFGMIAAAPISFFASIGKNLESTYMLFCATTGLAMFATAITQHAHQRGGIIGRIITYGMFSWMITLPFLSLVHANAYNSAGGIADAMRKGIATSIENKPSDGLVYCDGFPGYHKGVVIFFDEIDQLLWPLIGRANADRLILVNENFLHRQPDLPPFRDSAKQPGFVHLYWKNGKVEDATTETLEKLSHIEKSDTEEKMLLKVVDTEPVGYHLTPPDIEIEPTEIVPPASITRLCFEMILRETSGTIRDGYTLTWIDKSGGYMANLPYKPGADGFVCTAVDRDPRWVLADYLTELYVTPHPLHGIIVINKAEIIFRTKVIEIVEEVILEKGHPLLEFLQQ